MGIQDEDIASVRAATDIVAVVSEHVALKRVGRRWVGLCPFHSEKSGSFSVNAEEKLYYCFGCGAKGDVITFVREIEHLDFVGAVEKLAAKAGIALRYTDEGQNEGRRRRAKLLAAVERAGGLVPPAAPVGPGRRGRPRLPALPGPHRRRRAGLPHRLGAERLGRAGPGPAAARRRVRRRRAGVPQQPRAAPPTPSGAGCCSRSSTWAAPWWASAGGSCPAPRAPSTRTPSTARSTTSPVCCTGSTGPRPTSCGPTRRSSARATPT